MEIRLKSVNGGTQPHSQRGGGYCFCTQPRPQFPGGVLRDFLKRFNFVDQMARTV